MEMIIGVCCGIFAGLCTWGAWMGLGLPEPYKWPIIAVGGFFGYLAGRSATP